jgi:hypothetical protein
LYGTDVQQYDAIFLGADVTVLDADASIGDALPMLRVHDGLQ